MQRWPAHTVICARLATAKQTHSGSNSKFAFAISEMQGWRVCESNIHFIPSILVVRSFYRYGVLTGDLPSAMEDAHAVELDLDEAEEKDTNAFFAVYDGHGGASDQLFFCTVLRLRPRSLTHN